jgi:IS605 OrfB family transposase
LGGEGKNHARTNLNLMTILHIKQHIFIIKILYQGKIVVINQADSDEEDLMRDFVSLVTSFVARLYGLRGSKRKTERLIKELKMIRKSTVNLKYANKGKLEKINTTAIEYRRVVNIFIDTLWEQKQFSGKFVKNTQVESQLSARLKQAAAKQALAIVKSQRKKKKKHKPRFNKLVMELDSRFVTITQDGDSSFDIWVKLSSVGNKIILNLPSRKHKHINKLIDTEWQIKKSVRIRVTDKGCFLDMFFQKKAPAPRTDGKLKAIDIGYKKLIVSSDGEFIGDSDIYEKIARKKQGSKAFRRALTERDNLIDRSCNQLKLNDVRALYAEDLKNVKHKSEGKIRKSFNNKLQRWVYPKVLAKLSMLCEEGGIIFKKVPPRYTSRRCCGCGVIDKKNRRGETYRCACGLLMDADENAAKNILHLGAYSPQVSYRKPPEC